MQELDLAKDAIFTQKTSPAARNRYIYYPDRIVRMPHPHWGLADNLWSLLTEPVFKTAILSCIRELVKEPRDPSLQDESIGDFISRRFSRELVDRLLSALVHGIYAGDVWQLSVKSLFPALWRAEGEHHSVIYGVVKSRSEGTHVSAREMNFLEDMKKFAWDPLLEATLEDNSVFTFKEGLGMLSERLHAKLFETGQVDLKTSTPVASVTLADGGNGVDVTAVGSSHTTTHTHIISALSPEHLNKVCRIGATGPALIETIPTVNVMTVNLYFRTPSLHKPGFGYLIPQATPFENNPERALGVVFDTAYAPSPSNVEFASKQVDVVGLENFRDTGRLINVNDFAWFNMPDTPNLQDHVKKRGTKVTVMLGGHWWNGWPTLPNEKEGLAMARSVLARHLGIKEEPEAWLVNLEKNCIPQYTVGHEQRLKQARSSISRRYKGRLRVAGNWMSGVGVNDCLRSAYEVAKNLSQDGATGLEHVGEVANLLLAPREPGQIGK